jgi:hypothetical protein
MTVAPTSTCNKTTKVKRLKEDGFVFFAFFLFGFCFVVGLFFRLLSSLESSLSPKI